MCCPPGPLEMRWLQGGRGNLRPSTSGAPRRTRSPQTTVQQDATAADPVVIHLLGRGATEARTRSTGGTRSTDWRRPKPWAAGSVSLSAIHLRWKLRLLTARFDHVVQLIEPLGFLETSSSPTSLRLLAPTTRHECTSPSAALDGDGDEPKPTTQRPWVMATTTWSPAGGHGYWKSTSSCSCTSRSGGASSSQRTSQTCGDHLRPAARRGQPRLRVVGACGGLMWWARKRRRYLPVSRCWKALWFRQLAQVR